jgi:hypothetical protein
MRLKMESSCSGSEFEETDERESGETDESELKNFDEVSESDIFANVFIDGRGFYRRLKSHAPMFTGILLARLLCKLTIPLTYQ